MLTPIGEILFEQLELAVLYDPDEKTAIVYYVYYRSIERRPSGIANGRFFMVTRNLEELFSGYYTTIFSKFFEGSLR